LPFEFCFAVSEHRISSRERDIRGSSDRYSSLSCSARAFRSRCAFSSV